MSFLLAFSTVFPMFFYMAAGFGLRRLNKLSEGTVAQMNKIIYSFCFPFVLFHNVYGVDIASAMNGPFLAVIAGMGGETIGEILFRGRDVLKAAHLVLQPNVAAPELRAAIAQNGFAITDEVIVRDGRRLYPVIAAAPDSPARISAAARTSVPGSGPRPRKAVIGTAPALRRAAWT